MKKKLTPSDLQMKSSLMSVSGKYDWKKQSYQYDECKFGTGGNTSNGTSFSTFNGGVWSDDANRDQWSD